MSVGLEIRNDSGVLIISQAFRNYHLIEKGTFVIPAGDSVVGGTFVFSRSGRTFPVLAIRAPALVGSNEQVVSGGTITRTFSTPLLAASVTVEFWLFDVLSTPPATFGLEVYDAAGNLAYASGQAPMRIVGEVVMSAYTNTSGTFGAGRTYAAVQTFAGFAQDNTETVPDFFVTKRIVGMASWSGTAITCRRNFTQTKIREFDEDIPGFSYETQPPRWLIVDVTNI
jgi:hypothetical protein